MKIGRSEAQRSDTISHYGLPIPLGSEVVVETGDSAVLFDAQDRTVLATLRPGRHTLSSEENDLPVSGETISAQLAFISTTPQRLPRKAFSARVTDPRSGLAVTVGVAGTWMVRIVAPSRCLAELPTEPNDGILEAATTCHLARAVARHVGRSGDLLEATRLPSAVLAQRIAEAAGPIMADAGLELVEVSDVRLVLDELTRAAIGAAAEAAAREGTCAGCGDTVPLGPLCLCGGSLRVTCPECGAERSGTLEVCPSCGLAA